MKVLCFLALLLATAHCQTYWPFDYFGYGYDLLTDEPTAPVIRLTFTEGREWRSGVTGLLYQLPDQVEVMDYSESGLAKVVDIIRNITEYQHAAASWHNFGISFFGLFGFQFSKESEDVKKILEDGKYVLFVAYKQFQFFELASWPYSILNQSESHFSRSVLQLPETYNDEQDRQAYSDCIGEFGTSYFERARYGGDIKYFIRVSSELLYSESEEWVSFQVGLFVTYMDIQFGFDYGRNVSRVNISEKFWENAHAYCIFRPFGDDLQDCSNLTSIGFQNWVGAAMEQPVMLSPALRNISDLIADDTKRKNMEEAIVYYLNTPPPNGTELLRNRTVASKTPAKPIRIRADDTLPLIPGYNIIGMGLDASKMEYTVVPVVPLTTVENQTYSCTSDNQYGPGCWQNPFYPDYNFFIPWNVYLENTPNSNLVNGSQIFQSYDDFQSYYSHTTSHHSFFGSKSKTVSYFYEKYFEEDSALVFQFQSRSWYQLTLPPIPPPQMHPIASQVIDQLPSVYDSQDPNNVRMYLNAIQNLGTHFVYSAMFGGTQQMTAWFHKCMVSTYSMSWIEEQSGWSFFGIISDNSGKINYNSKLNVNFTQWSSVQVDYSGGKAFAYEPSDYDDWVLTLKDRPVPTSYQLMPISMLIQDPEKSASYESAVKDYLKNSYDVSMQYQQTESQKDPWTKPSWCHWTPPKQNRHPY